MVSELRRRLRKKATTLKRGIREHYSVNPGAFSNLVIWITSCTDHPVVWAGDLSVKDHLCTALASSVTPAPLLCTIPYLIYCAAAREMFKCLKGPVNTLISLLWLSEKCAFLSIVHLLEVLYRVAD